MIRKNYLLFLGILLTTLSSCDVLLRTAGELAVQNKPLSTEEIKQGLKEALRVGVDTALTRLHAENGYYLDSMVKINLPPETDEVLKYARRVPGLDSKIETLIRQVNRSAEDAALSAAPVFYQAIRSMSIDDARSILAGEKDAATNYLHRQTYDSLVSVYLPTMNRSLDKPIVAGISANQSWSEISGQWNKFATSLAGRLLEVQTLDTRLDLYVTRKALDGVFLKVAIQEAQIRTKAEARVNQLLERVFGNPSLAGS
ncbi:DUF4197 domain-containing protein [Roseimarinus sediminis]|uniref:DUF4197 domain-containing protein n=1 Tax=Roseimarinus sediminis TaxID=1610899 RepID=UPI003D1A9287